MKAKYLVAAAAVAVIIPAAGMVYSKASDTPESKPEFITINRASGVDTDFTKAAESTVNSVVCIKSYVERNRQYGGNQGYYDPFGMFDFFFGPQQRQQPQQKKSEPVQSGLGSGVILSKDGYIVTNNHVIDGADRLEVLLNDNSTYDARVIGTDESTDLALIKIDADDLHAIKIGDSEALKLGEWVLAVGNPFGFNSTVTAGIVSAKARSLGNDSHRNKMGIEAFIQTDAALNPGNSGGALVNLNGELVGINAAIYSNTGSYTGFSFAIPTTIAAKVIADLREYGTVQRAVLGITVADLTADLAKEKGITATKSGVLVAGVSDRSTAKELGLKENDVIVAINGVEIKNLPELHEQLAKYRPGNEISVSYYNSDNTKVTKKALLRNTQGDTGITKKGDFSEIGCAFMKVGESTLKQLGISNGVKVTGLKGGPFKDAGVREGFIIIEINDRPVKTSDDVESIYNRIMKEDNEDKLMVLKGIYSNGKKGYYAVNLAE